MKAARKGSGQSFMSVCMKLGTVLRDLNASVHTLQSHGDQQIADAIEKLVTAITNSTETADPGRKDLLENLALVSNEV
jgi:hypothetical protein